jgi:hypothetical protein
VPKYLFLSDEWFAEARRIVDQRGVDIPSEARLAMNLVVTSSPNGSPDGGDQLLHIGTNDGSADWGPGHFDAADLTLTTDYVTARDIFVSGNPQAAMQAFMEGKVKLQGDLTRLMAAQAVGSGPGAPDLAAALAEMTE